jgi:hypothetical protein
MNNLCTIIEEHCHDFNGLCMPMCSCIIDGLDGHAQYKGNKCEDHYSEHDCGCFDAE